MFSEEWVWNTHTKGANAFGKSILRDSGERDIFLLFERKNERTAFEVFELQSILGKVS